MVGRQSNGQMCATPSRWVRNGTVLAWDYDVDVRIAEADLPKLYEYRKALKIEHGMLSDRDGIQWDWRMGLQPDTQVQRQIVTEPLTFFLSFIQLFVSANVLRTRLGCTHTTIFVLLRIYPARHIHLCKHRANSAFFVFAYCSGRMGLGILSKRKLPEVPASLTLANRWFVTRRLLQGLL